MGIFTVKSTFFLRMFNTRTFLRKKTSKLLETFQEILQDILTGCINVHLIMLTRMLMQLFQVKSSFELAAEFLV